MLWKDGKKKAFTLSYDDGVIHDRRFIELLKKYGLSCTFNLNSGAFEEHYTEIDYSKPYDVNLRQVRISADEVHDLYEGFEVASHTRTHPHPKEISKDELKKEVLDDIKELKRLTGQNDIRGFAYPYGEYDTDVINVLKECGVVYARTVWDDESFSIPDDFLEWRPTSRHANPELLSLGQRFIESDKEGALMYVWGHTYELYTTNEWDKVETLFKMLKEHEDEIWFATNIEIYDWVTKHREA